MYDRHRFSARLMEVAAPLAAACALSTPTLAQSAKPSSSATPDTSAMTVASVNDDKITRGMIADELITQQTAKLSATNPIFEDRNRYVAGVIGALALKKMAESGGKPVTISRAEILNYIFKDNPPILFQVVQQAIAETAIRQEAKRAGIVTTPADIEAQMKKAIEGARVQYRLKGSDTDVLKQIGVTDAYLRPHVRTQLLLEKIVRKEMDAKTGKPFGDADYVSASHILVTVKTDPANPAETEKRFAEAKTKIQAIADEIKSGKKTFEQAASETNEDSTKFKNGSLGTFTRGQMVADFDKAVFALPKGQVSEPVRTPFGWHLIRVDKVGSEFTGPEKEKLVSTAVQSRASAKVSELIKKAKVVNNVKPPAQAGGGGLMSG